MFYLGFSALLDLATTLIAVKTGGFAVVMSRTGWTVFYGSLWLISFLLSWPLVITPLFDRIQQLKKG